MIAFPSLLIPEPCRILDDAIAASSPLAPIVVPCNSDIEAINRLLVLVSEDDFCRVVWDPRGDRVTVIASTWAITLRDASGDSAR